MYKLIHESKGYEGKTFSQPPKRIEMTLDTEDADLNELCEFFGDFLKACTFTFDGKVEINDCSESDFINKYFQPVDPIDGDSYPHSETPDTADLDWGIVPTAPQEKPTSSEAQTELNFEAKQQ